MLVIRLSDLGQVHQEIDLFSDLVVCKVQIFTSSQKAVGILSYHSFLYRINCLDVP